MPPGLPEVRAELDRIDAEIIRLLAIRMAEVMKAAQIKHAAGIPFRDEEREEQVIENAVERGEDFGLPKKQVRKIFKQIGNDILEAPYAGDIIQTFKSQGVAAPQKMIRFLAPVWGGTRALAG